MLIDQLGVVGLKSVLASPAPHDEPHLCGSRLAEGQQGHEPLSPAQEPFSTASAMSSHRIRYSATAPPNSVYRRARRLTGTDFAKLGLAAAAGDALTGCKQKKPRRSGDKGPLSGPTPGRKTVFPWRGKRTNPKTARRRQCAESDFRSI